MKTGNLKKIIVLLLAKYKGFQFVILVNTEAKLSAVHDEKKSYIYSYTFAVKMIRCKRTLKRINRKRKRNQTKTDVDR